MKPVSGFKPDTATGHDTKIWYFEIGARGNWAQICPDQSPYQVLAENHEIMVVPMDLEAEILPESRFFNAAPAHIGFGSWFYKKKDF